MTVSSTTSRISYAGDNATLIFAYPFKIFEATDLVAILTTAGVDVPLVLITDYTVTGVGLNDGGSITMRVAPPTGSILTIRRVLPITQEADYHDGDSFPAEAHETCLDRLTMIAQQLDEKVGRVPTLSPSTQLNGLILPDPVSGKPLLGNPAGDGFINGDLLPTLVPATNMDVAGFVKNGADGVLQGGQSLPITSETVQGLAQLASVAEALAGVNTAKPVTPAGVQAKVSAAMAAIPFSVPVRQTVLASPVDTAGLPTFLPTTAASLNLATQNLAAGSPLVVTAAKGAGIFGTVDAMGQAVANLTWTGLTASRAAATPNFLYVVINSDGTLTPGFTLLPPIYQWGGTPAVTAGQFTFNIQQMTGYLGNGTTAPQVNAVFLGEAATNTTTVISTVAYALMGRYRSADVTPTPSANVLVTLAANLGVVPQEIALEVECITTDGGCAVGDILGNIIGYPSDVYAPMPLIKTKNIIGFHTGNSGGFYCINKSNGAIAALTAANWKYRMIAKRGW